MKKTLATALVLALLAGTASYAQQGQNSSGAQVEKQKREDKQDRQQKRDRADKPTKTPKAEPAKADKPQAPQNDRQGGKAQGDRDGPGRVQQKNDRQAGERPVVKQQVIKQRTVVKRPGEGRALRTRDQGRRAFDQNRWRPSYVSPRKYRISAYRRPNGWYANSWSRGAYLPRGWFIASYYLNRASYGLPYPPIGCEWVRVGEDALLVDIWTGRVLSVYRNVFW
jgi:Ni/Co efflux regulator RcnB